MTSFVSLRRRRKSVEKAFARDMKIDSWNYLAEGNAHIIFTYVGAEEALKGLVLRLAKEKKPFVGSALKGVAAIAHLVDARHIPRAYRVTLTHGHRMFLVQLNGRLHSFSRPLFRLHRSIDVHSGFAVLQANSAGFQLFAGGPAVCVEIKPKSAASVKGQDACRFCLHQQMKLQNGLIRTRSKYCAHNFFRSSQKGLAKCIENLFTTPQNNLRVFVDGKVTFPGKDKMALDEALSKIFQTCSFDSLGMSKRASVINALCDVISKVIVKEGVRDKLEEAQRIACLSVEEIFDLGLFDTIVRNEIIRHIDDLRLVHGYTNELCGSFLWCVRNVHSYLLSRVAMDCSLLVTIAPLQRNMAEKSVSDVGDASVIRINGQVFLYKVKLIDLDMKSFRKLPRYLIQEQNLKTISRTEVTSCGALRRQHIT